MNRTATFFMLFLLLVLTTFPVLAQPPDALWTRLLGDPWVEEKCSDLQLTADGGFIITGYQYPSDPGYDVYLLKTDPDGHEVWSRTYDRSTFDFGKSVKQTADGGYILTGASDHELMLLKVDSQGDQEWVRFFNLQYSSGGLDIQITVDDGYIIVGTESNRWRRTNVWLVRLDSEGTELWNRSYGRPAAYDEASSVQQTSDGCFIVSGLAQSVPGNVEGPFLMKVDENGEILWLHTYHLIQYNSIFNVRETSDGGFIAVGRVGYVNWNHDPSQSDFAALLKTDSEGTVEWWKLYGGIDDEVGYDVRQTMNGGYVLSGKTETYGQHVKDMWVVRTDSQGTKLWDYVHDVDPLSSRTNVHQLPDGGYVAAGTVTTDQYTSSCQILLVRLASESAQPQRSITPAGNNQGEAFSVYPNPFNAATTVSVDLPNAADLNVRLFNMIGQQVGTLATGTYAAGKHSITLDGSTFPSGTYFIQLSQPGAADIIQRVVLLK